MLPVEAERESSAFCGASAPDRLCLPGNSSSRKIKNGAGVVPEHLLHAAALNTGHEHGLFINTELPSTYEFE